MKTKLVTLSVFLFIIGSGLGSWGYTLFLKYQNTNKSARAADISPQPTQVTDYVESDQNVIDLNSKSYNIVLLGHGGEGHSGGSLMDSIVLVHIEAENKKAVLISVPRDLWYTGHKLNAEYSITPGSDGFNRIKNALAAITGLYVENYIAIDFSSFVRIVDEIGGIEIDIPKPYTDNYYPVKGLENELCGKTAQEVADLHTKYSGFNLEKQFECRYEQIHFDTGRTTLDGSTALKYVRSRHGDGDFGRSERQFFLLKGLITKNLSVDTVVGFTKMVKTDLDSSKIKGLIKLFEDPLGYEIKTIHLSDANVLVASKSSAGAYILIPRAGEGNFEEIKSFIAK